MANQNEIAKAIEEFALKRISTMQSKLVEDIKADTPVDTGRARAGTQTVKEVTRLGETGIIRNEVPYIGWLEFGNSRGSFEYAMFRRSIAKVNQ